VSEQDKAGRYLCIAKSRSKRTCMTAADENMSIQCKKGCLVIEMLSFSYAWYPVQDIKTTLAGYQTENKMAVICERKYQIRIWLSMQMYSMSINKSALNQFPFVRLRF